MTHRPANTFLTFSMLLAMLLAPQASRAESQTVYERFTKESRSLAGWKKRKSACKYAIAAAKHKAIKACKKNKGRIVEVTPKKSKKRRKTLDQCTRCTRSKHWNEWYCTGKVTVNCRYESDKKGTGLVNTMRGVLRDKTKAKTYTETDNPCVKDTQTYECMAYRKQKNMSQGVRD